MTDNKDLRNIIELQLQQVYDPEFPLIDIWTLGLIYHIAVDEEQEIITITMTYTTPACPDGELMQQMIINQLQ
jgi:metal-sulfur cluster biosynthetic enzyme